MALLGARDGRPGHLAVQPGRVGARGAYGSDKGGPKPNWRTWAVSTTDRGGRNGPRRRAAARGGPHCCRRRPHYAAAGGHRRPSDELTDGARAEARPQHRLLGGGPPPGVARVDRRGRAARARLDLDRRGLRLRLPHPARLVGLADREASSSAPAIMQMSARQPAAAAMAAMTMDHLSGGRFILGLGVSGPQVVEGWYGMPFAKPLARTREYVGDPARHLGAQGPGDRRRPALSAAAARTAPGSASR